MEVAKVTSKGQITIPISIRRKLEINEGDKVLFIYRPDGVLMVNPNTFQGVPADYVEDGIVAEDEIVTKEVVVEKKVVKTTPKAAETKQEVYTEEVIIEETVTVEPAAVEAVTPEPPVRRPAPPPVPIEEPDKPEPRVGGLDLSSILDDIRSIGSNI